MIMTARWSGSLAASAADENSLAIDVTAVIDNKQSRLLVRPLCGTGRLGSPGFAAARQRAPGSRRCK